jgi:hypothetical protein
VAVSFALDSAGSILAGAITATATYDGPSGDDRRNDLYLRFNDGAVLPLIEDWDGSNAINYLAPTLDGTTLTVAAYVNSWANGPYAVAHSSGLAPGSASVSLAIPDYPVLFAPVNSVAWSPSTNFRFNPGQADQVHLFAFESVRYWDHLYIVTAETSTTVPVLESWAYTFLPGEEYFWWVETHGSYASVDDATGEDGWLDTFARSGSPQGPPRTSGTYASSTTRLFTTPGE